MVLIESLNQNILAVLVSTGAIRSAAGYLENVFKDGKVTKFELLNKGVPTLFRIGIMTAAFYLPFSALGLDAAAMASGGSAVVLDFILHAFKIKKPEEEKK